LYGASDGASCLTFTAASTTCERCLQGRLINGCEKAVAAYGLAVTVKYRDGTSEVTSGMGQDLILGLIEPTEDRGPIQPGSQRETPQWTLGTLEQGPHFVVSWRDAKVSSVIFIDNSFAGDDQEQVDRIFSMRKGDLREYRFWRDTFQFYKPELPGFKSLSELITLAKVPEREQAKRSAERPTLVTEHAEEMRAYLEALDSKITSGSTTREEAVDLLEKRLTWLVTTLEQHTQRRK
jgi:hypothetical protein